MSPGNPIEVWLGVGDSEMAGRGDDALPVGYPPTAGSVWMVRSSLQVEPLSEPTGDDGSPSLGNGPLGFFAAERAARTGKKIVIVNAGKGSAKSALWVPGHASTYFSQALERTRIALRQPGAKFAGIIQFDGLNDATDAVPAWDANWTTAHAAFHAELDQYASGSGAYPVYGIVYPATVPTDTSYPSHAALRVTIASAAFFDAVVNADEGPWVEPTLVHLDTAANASAGEDLDAAIP